MRNARIGDLAKALRTGKDVHNKNHTTMVRDGTRAFDAAHSDCVHCELNLVCLGGKEINWFTANADKRACATGRCLIQFQYHATVCLTYDRMRNRVTDHWQHGRSVTTSRSIRWYLEALQENDVIPYGVDINEVLKVFKMRSEEKGEGWIPCP